MQPLHHTRSTGTRRRTRTFLSAFVAQSPHPEVRALNTDGAGDGNRTRDAGLGSRHVASYTTPARRPMAPASGLEPARRVLETCPRPTHAGAGSLRGDRRDSNPDSRSHNPAPIPSATATPQRSDNGAPSRNRNGTARIQAAQSTLRTGAEVAAGLEPAASWIPTRRSAR